jgi:uncharacterized damage-inducible protein DinB
MHPLVEMQHVTRGEFLRGLEGLSDEDARRRMEPMNCISWIVGHVAHQERAFFVAWPRGEQPEARYGAFGYAAPPSQPSLEEAMALWREASEDADALLHSATEEGLRQLVLSPDPEVERENLGTRIVRNIFHYWAHVGEISAIRQVLGHRPPDFVDLHGWSYGGAPPTDRLSSITAPLK